MTDKEKIEAAFPGWSIFEDSQGFVATSPFTNAEGQRLSVPITFMGETEAHKDLVIGAALDSVREAMEGAGID